MIRLKILIVVLLITGIGLFGWDTNYAINWKTIFGLISFILIFVITIYIKIKEKTNG